MGVFIFLIFIVIVIALIRKSSKSDDNFQKKDSSNTMPSNNAKYYYDNVDEFFEDEDNFDDELFIETFEEPKRFFSKNSERSFFDRIMDSSTPESTFVKGLYDDGYDVEDW